MHAREDVVSCRISSTLKEEEQKMSKAETNGVTPISETQGPDARERLREILIREIAEDGRQGTLLADSGKVAEGDMRDAKTVPRDWVV